MTAAADLRSLRSTISKLPKDIVRAGARRLKRPLDDSVRRDSGGDRRLSGLRNSGRFAVSTSVRGTDTVKGRVYAGPSAMRAPWSWLDKGTRPRRQGRGQHPGTRGKNTWTDTADREVEAAMRAMVNEWQRRI
jgi:hypothetical protein